jgi:acetyl-CoA acetyltransferase family protein
MAANDRDVVLVDGVRTPFAKAGSELKDMHAADLGTTALTELLARTQIAADVVDEVIIGNTGSPADAVNISRVVALRSGIPLKTSAYTVHRNCASALESIATGFDKIKSGTLDVVVAGGTESMSKMPIMVSQKFVDIFNKLFAAKGPGQALPLIGKLLKADFKQVMALLSANQRDPYFPQIAVVQGLTDPFVGINMGQTAENIAKDFSITREEQDQFALRSHQKAVEATKSGRLRQEITPVYQPPKFKTIIADDIGPRDGQSMEQLGKLKPFFDKKYGSITVGNACPITDGAAMILLMSRGRARELGLKPAAKILSYAFAGLEPERMGLGPAYSTPIALKRAGLTLKDMDLIELNEAFAAQVIGCMKAMASQKFSQEKLGLSQAVGEIDPNKLNVNGGAIALGHPVGATGTRLVVTLMKELQKRDKNLGLATLCIGGGQGGTMVIEREN